MTDTSNQNSDNGSVINDKLVENAANCSNFSKNEQISAENTEHMCKNDDNYPTEFQELCGNTTVASAPVSSLDSVSTSKNDDINFVQISKEEDDLLFSRLFPGVSRENVENDHLFKIFARGRSKEGSFVAIYSDYLSLVNEITKETQIKATFSKMNGQSAVGPLSSAESHNEGFFTKEQVLRMTREQIAQNYDNIRKSQSRW